MSVKSLEIAKYVGTPIDINQKAPPFLMEIANPDTAEPGELVYTLSGDDTNGVDTIYTVDSNGVISTVKITMTAPALLTFAHLNTKLQYVLVSEIAETVDQGALARRKVSLTRSLDKIEAKRSLDLLLAVASQEVVQASLEDIYDLIKKMVRKVDDFGDNYILLCGKDIWEAIDDYNKKQAKILNYEVDINAMLANLGVKKMKITGKIKLDSGADLPLLATNKMILVARDSSLQAGKPVIFIRRKIAGIVGGGTVDANERGLWVAESPAPLYGNAETLGYGVYSYESVCEALLNYRAIAWTTYAE